MRRQIRLVLDPRAGLIRVSGRLGRTLEVLHRIATIDDAVVEESGEVALPLVRRRIVERIAREMECDIEGAA